ncbi:hypothetical protein HK099_000805 [Clydaea vesicula]|uniref:Uncharacterized protein n=1 Tax=Clydaea vesicula TaxID=447962 RepID=A0AAD5U5E8_9FUNG|nr:hypothetical protein HK099_000805 [Clydaea vesicula]
MEKDILLQNYLIARDKEERDEELIDFEEKNSKLCTLLTEAQKKIIDLENLLSEKNAEISFFKKTVQEIEIQQKENAKLNSKELDKFNLEKFEERERLNEEYYESLLVLEATIEDLKSELELQRTSHQNNMIHEKRIAELKQDSLKNLLDEKKLELNKQKTVFEEKLDVKDIIIVDLQQHLETLNLEIKELKIEKENSISLNSQMEIRSVEQIKNLEALVKASNDECDELTNSFEKERRCMKQEFEKNVLDLECVIRHNELRISELLDLIEKQKQDLDLAVNKNQKFQKEIEDFGSKMLEKNVLKLDIQKLNQEIEKIAIECKAKELKLTENDKKLLQMENEIESLEITLEKSKIGAENKVVNLVAQFEKKMEDFEKKKFKERDDAFKKLYNAKNKTEAELKEFALASDNKYETPNFSNSASSRINDERVLELEDQNAHLSEIIHQMRNDMEKLERAHPGKHEVNQNITTHEQFLKFEKILKEKENIINFLLEEQIEVNLRFESQLKSAVSGNKFLKKGLVKNLDNKEMNLEELLSVEKNLNSCLLENNFLKRKNSDLFFELKKCLQENFELMELSNFLKFELKKFSQVEISLFEEDSKENKNLNNKFFDENTVENTHSLNKELGSNMAKIDMSEKNFGSLQNIPTKTLKLPLQKSMNIKNTLPQKLYSKTEHRGKHEVKEKTAMDKQDLRLRGVRNWNEKDD